MIDDETGTEYKDKISIETKSGTKELSSPYTNYSVTVIDNIKGILITDKRIPIQKTGGVSEDGKTIVLFEDDAMLEAGKYYILIAYTQRDGSLLISGPNSSILLGDDRDKALSSADYNRYIKAVENEVTTNLKRYKIDYT